MIMRHARKALAMLVLGLIVGGLAQVALAQAQPAKPQPPTPDPAQVDPIMGDYEGTYTVDEQGPTPAEAKVAALGDGAYLVLLKAEPRSEGDWPLVISLDGRRFRDEIYLTGSSMGRDWIGTIKDGALNVFIPHLWGGRFDLKQVRRESPTLGLAPPANAVVLLPFDGNPPSQEAWATRWAVTEDGAIMCSGGNLHSVEAFGDCRFHLEFNLPYEPNNRGQNRGNSGVYFQERYEVQILDSFGLAPASGDSGSLYRWAATRLDAPLPPLSWQTLDILFRAPRFDAQGNVTELPRMTVDLNGIRVHDNVVLEDGTGGHREGFVPLDTIRLQDHRHQVRFRNIWLVKQTIE